MMINKNDDVILVKSIKNDEYDNSNFNSFYSQFKSPVMEYILYGYNFLSLEQNAEIICNDVFMEFQSQIKSEKVYVQNEQLFFRDKKGEEKPISNLISYLKGIARNKRYEAWKIHKRKAISIVNYDPLEFLKLNLNIDEEIVDEEVKNLIWEKVAEVIRTLSDKKQKLLELRFWEEKSHKEIDEELGYKSGGAKKTLGDIMKIFRRSL